jgi:hypothetical protein
VRDKTCEDVVISRSEKSEAESSKKAGVLGSEYLRLGKEKSKWVSCMFLY